MTPMTCRNYTWSEYSQPEQILFGYTLPAMCLGGVLANLFNVMILADKRLGAPTYVYLAYLAIADLITLLLYSVELVAKIHFADQLWYHIFSAYIYLPIGSITTSSSLLLTVTVTIDRYLFIQNPTAITSHAIPVSIQLATPRKRARLIGALVCLLAAVVNAPRMVIWYVDFETGCKRARSWGTFAGGWYTWYSYIRFILLNTGSILMMAIFNALLIVLVTRSTTGLQACRQRRQSSVRRAFNKTNVSLTITLIAATLLALSGEIPSTLFSRITAKVLWEVDLKKPPYSYYVLAAYILMILEYSGNFVIYCVLNKRFRLVFKSKFCSATCKSQQGQIALKGVEKKPDNDKINNLTGKQVNKKLITQNSFAGCNGFENSENMVTGMPNDNGDQEDLSQFWRAEQEGKSPPPSILKVSLSDFD